MPPHPDACFASQLARALSGVLRGAEAGATLLLEGEPARWVAVVEAGLGRCVSYTLHGRRHIQRFVPPGGVFGLRLASAYRLSLEAATPLRAKLYPRDAVHGLIARDAAARAAHLVSLAARLDAHGRAQLRLGRLGARERVADYLLELAQAESGGRDAGVALAMSRLDLGDHLGLTLETVSRTLNQLHRDGVISLAGPHHFRVPSMARLARTAGADPLGPSIAVPARPSGVPHVPHVEL